MFTIPNCPSELAAKIAAHRQLFAGWTMTSTPPESGENGSGGGTTTEPPANGSGQQQQPPAKPAPPAKARQVDDDGDSFPLETPLSEMTDAEKAAYWKHQARKHEKGERAATKSVEQQIAAAVAAAIKDYDSTKTRQAQLDAAEGVIRATLTSRGKSDEEVSAAVELLDLTKFLTADGKVDAAKVKTYADGTVPANGSRGRWPDMGQGNRGGSTTPTGLKAGADLYAERHPEKKQQQ